MILLYLLSAFIVILACAALPTSLASLLADPALLNSFPAVKSVLPLIAYAKLIWFLRLAVAIFSWASGAYILWAVRRRPPAQRRMGIYTAFLLLLLPLSFALNSQAGAAGLPAPWELILGSLIGLFSTLGLVLFADFYYIYPDGSFSPGWLRWPVILGMLVILAGFMAIALIPNDLEWAWGAVILLYMFYLLAGAVVLLLRYFRQMADEQKRQARWVVAVMTAQTVYFLPMILAQFAGGSLDQPAWALADLLLQILLPALIPVALLSAVVSRRLWTAPEEAPPPRRGLIGAISACAVGILLAAVYLLALRPPAAGRILFNPLPESDAPRPLIVDSDMAPDDWMALLYLLQRPELEVKAITVSGTGETHCQPGVVNALSLARLAGARGIPVACGRETPLQGDHAFPEALRTRADTLNGLSLPAGEVAQPGLNAVDLLVETIQASPEPVTLLALGPLTNLAEALQRQPEISANIAQIYVMGGALETLGNVGYFGIDNQVAEWNIYVDPLAAQIVVDSGAPVTLVPLDATDDVPVDLDFFFKLQANRQTPEAQFVYEILESQLDFIISGGYSFWDPLAAAILADENLGYIKNGIVRVVTQEGPSSGLTRLLANGSPVRYAHAAQAKDFYLDFLRTLNQSTNP